MKSSGFQFIILGGGTAGWMAACLLAKKWPQHHVTVVESPEIGIIGVGEGSTPQLRSFFRTLGIAESEWMPKCNATYKNGIRFNNWSNRAGYQSYFHPFQTELDYRTAPAFFQNCRARRTGRDVCAHPDRFFVSAALGAQRRGPIPGQAFPFDIAYGYHFDANLVGKMLRDHAVSVLGVRHLERTVHEVVLDSAGNVIQLLTDNAEPISGNFFIDCSGFRSTILQSAMAEPFISYASNLFNDAAIAMPTPNDKGTTPCETGATALSAGWAWRIPLTNRAGNGYVYSSSHISADAAETELRSHLGMLESDVEARHLQMRVGRVERCWVKNCLAIGLSQGFIEPLEATALHIVQSSVEQFIEAFDKGGFSNVHADSVNRSVGARFEGIRDYIVGHYRLNQRGDHEYWRDNASNQQLSDSIKALMTSWFTGADFEAEIFDQDIQKYYAPLSWHCLFAGYGTFPADQKLRAAELELGLIDMTEVDDFVARCALNFADHDVLLNTLGGPK